MAAQLSGQAAAVTDTTIVRARIHPGIGVARIGDSTSGFFIGPEVTEPPPLPAADYRDSSGTILRQVARFRVYGYNAAGQVVAELTEAQAQVTWTAHLVARKAQWYQFQAAMDLVESVALTVTRRNPDVPYAARGELAIDPGPRSISGVNVSGAAYQFNTGTFKQTTTVPLGELQTDSAGRLLVFGGTGWSESPSGAPVYIDSIPGSFNNANDWFDDTSDGSVDATVVMNGVTIPCEGAWVIVAPPDYGPAMVGWRTMDDMMRDVWMAAGWLPVPATPSFTRDILPVLRRLTGLQWVNAGFAAMFGAGGPLDFNNQDLIAKLAAAPDAATKADPYHELRNTLLNSFRPYQPTDNNPRPWPWLYGDAYGFVDAAPNSNLALSAQRQLMMQRWAAGTFVADWQPGYIPPQSLDDVPLAEQPGMLDQSAMHFCLADAFHPGCEMTWPMRHATLYTSPYRIRRRPEGWQEPDYGKTLDQKTALQPDGPLAGQQPGDITRWMALPWQGDTAYCRSGYDPQYDPYVPSFWTARVPNQVLTQDDYKIVMDATQPMAVRIAAFNRRQQWMRPIDTPDVAETMMRMIANFGAMGIVGPQPGPTDTDEFPNTLFVETQGTFQDTPMLQAAALATATPSVYQRAGFQDEDHWEAARRTRVRAR